jgi:hypothetical protein
MAAIGWIETVMDWLETGSIRWALLAVQADGRDRTGDIRFTRAVLYQLSYVGVARIVAP